MMVAQTERVSVPSSEATILTVSEANAYQRTFYIRNWSYVTISLVFQKWGATGWEDIATTFDIGPAGGGNDVVVKNITDTGQLRLRGSGGSGA